MAIRMPRRGPAYPALSPLALSIRECQQSREASGYTEGQDADLRVPLPGRAPLRRRAALFGRARDRVRGLREARPSRPARPGGPLQGQGLLLDGLRQGRQGRERRPGRLELVVGLRLEGELVLGLRFEELRFRLQVGVEELRFEELGLQELGRRELVVQEVRQLQARSLTWP